MKKNENIESISQCICNLAQIAKIGCADCLADKPCYSNMTAEKLVNAGFGNIEQALNEFLDILLENSYDCGDLIEIEYDKAEKLLKEFLKNE